MTTTPTDPPSDREAKRKELGAPLGGGLPEGGATQEAAERSPDRDVRAGAAMPGV